MKTYIMSEQNQRFKYTLQDSTFLSNDQREFYEHNGYIVIKNLVSHGVLDECNKRFIDICNKTFDPGMVAVMKEASLMGTKRKGESIVNKMQLLSYDEVFFKYVSYEPILDVIQSIIGPNIIATHSMLINKPPDADPDCSQHPLHQDLHYFPIRPADKIVASWTAMEKTDENNGCLYVVPGTHHILPLLAHDYPKNMKNKGFHQVNGFENVPKMFLPMEKGDTVFFHPLLLHGSGPNLTKGYRKAISAHYASSDCHFIETKGTTQEKICEEMTNWAAITGVTVDIVGAWKLKSLCVRGKLGNFLIENKL